jgi:hypothetical protein
VRRAASSGSSPKYFEENPGPPGWQSSTGPEPTSSHASVRPSAVVRLGMGGHYAALRR